MAGQEFLRSDEDVEAILRLALREGASPTDDLEARLRVSARELGISEEAPGRAVDRYRAEQSVALKTQTRESLRKRFTALKRRDFLQHLAIYLAVNFGLVAIFARSGDFPSWLLWSFFGWGIGIVVHLVAACFPGTDEEREFERWLRKRGSGETQT